MRDDIEQIIQRLIEREGGYVNDPDDPGGETNMGISRRAHPDEDIKNMTQARAAQIYYEEYGKRINIDGLVGLNPDLAEVLLDAAANVGVSRAVSWVQFILGLPTDGIWGPRTEAAVAASFVMDPEWLIDQITLARIRHYVNLADGHKGNRKYLLGWVKRALEVRG